MPFYVNSGEIEIRSLIFEAGRARALLEVDNLFGLLAGRRLDRAHMTISYVDGRLTVADLRAQLEGGTLTSLGEGQGTVAAGGGTALALDLVDPYHFELAVRLGGGGVGENDAAVEGLLTGLFDSSVEDPGRVRGELLMSGRPDQLLGLRGSGVVELSDARLWSIPVVREFFSRLGFDSTASFDEMECRFELRDGTIVMTDLRVHSPLLNLVGSGTMDLDGDLHHHLDVRYSLFDRLGPLNRILYLVQNSLLRVEIRGDMTRPQVFLRNGLGQLLREHAEFERQLPLPSYSPLRTRF